MKRIFIAIICIGLATVLASCSIPMTIRVFNGGDHSIAVTNRKGKEIEIAPQNSALMILREFEEIKTYGIEILGETASHRYTLLITSEDDSKPYVTWSQPLDPRSQIKKTTRVEYLVEYENGLLYALEANKHETKPDRLEPQPTGFPIRPN